MSRLQYILNRLPQFYSKDNTSRIYNILACISSELDIFDTNIIMRLNSIIGINTTFGQDLDVRWGQLLNIKRILDESDDNYRLRLKTSVVRLSGGTAKSIQYAIAVILRIDNDQIAIDSRIKIYDSWEYTGNMDYLLGDRGSIICEIDFGGSPDWDISMDNIIIIVESVKACGVLSQFVMLNMGIKDYDQFSELKYYELCNTQYNNLSG